MVHDRTSSLTGQPQGMSAGAVLGTYPLPPVVGGSLADINQFRACLAPQQKGRKQSVPTIGTNGGVVTQSDHSPGGSMAWEGKAHEGVHGSTFLFDHQGDHSISDDWTCGILNMPRAITYPQNSLGPMLQVTDWVSMAPNFHPELALVPACLLVFAWGFICLCKPPSP